jgi:hypothetical protein
MKRVAKAIAAAVGAVLLIASLMPAGAGADEGFGLKGLDLAFLNKDGSDARQAGSHPFAVRTTIDVHTAQVAGKGELPIDAVRDLFTSLPPGFVGDRDAVQRCSGADFVDIVDNISGCSSSSAIGYVDLRIGYEAPQAFRSFVYNLVAPPGVAAKFGFIALGDVPVTLEIGVNPDPPYNLIVSATKIAQPIRFYGAELTIWGTPASPLHDAERPCESTVSCPASIPERPFITLPRSCPDGPLLTRIEVDSWQAPGAWLTYMLETPGMTGCAKLGFSPSRVASQPTTDQAESPSGLDFELDFDDSGLANPDGLAQTEIKKAVVTLPRGVTANPSVAEGLGVCAPAQYAAEKVDSEPGEGCPQASNIGRVEVETPLLEGELLKGQVFVAQQDDPATAEPGAENPFDSLIALYMVIKDRDLGIMVKLAGKVEPDPRTGQLVTTFGEPSHEVPQFPFSRFRFHFREGGRSPLITPPACGTYTTRAVFTPWAYPDRPLTTTADFQITRGTGGGPCPPAGAPPFAPGFTAGTLNNDAARYAPFFMRLTRRDGDQDLTRFTVDMPPGLLAKLAGTTRCADAAIEAAKARTGRAEQASPSCPASSEIGRVVGGAGVGSQLTYVPGKVYLAGPVGGAPLSVVGIVPAVAGPFDVGTVVVREALQIDRRTAEVRVDGALSDPIPHILAGIPLKVRDVRVHVDRPKFTLNPTSCDPFEVQAQIWGGGLDIFSTADDAPVSLAERFQAANCSRLGFKPRVSLRLRGGTARGDHPAVRGVLRPRKGDANLAKAVVRLPRSAFLDQAHIRTICTRVQFAADRCPKGAIYGRAIAYTPLLEKPLRGPIYLRSSNNDLPDVVLDLRGLVDIEAVARIDSKDGGIRATFTRTPDAPVTKVVVSFQGGKKGLIVNSRNLCLRDSRADLSLAAHNGRRRSLGPLVRAQCAKRR